MPNAFKGGFGEGFRFMGIVDKALSADDMEVISDHLDLAVEAIRQALRSVKNGSVTADLPAAKANLFGYQCGDTHHMFGLLIPKLDVEEMRLVNAQPEVSMAAIRAALAVVRAKVPPRFELSNSSMEFRELVINCKEPSEAIISLGGRPDDWPGNSVLDGRLDGTAIQAVAPARPDTLVLRIYQGRKFRLAGILEEISRDQSVRPATLAELAAVIERIPPNFIRHGIIASGTFCLHKSQGDPITVMKYKAPEGLSAASITDSCSESTICVLVAIND